MAETFKEQKTFRVEMECDDCGVGKMLPTDIVLLSSPAQYQHKCDECSYIANYYDTYPYVKTVDVDE